MRLQVAIQRHSLPPINILFSTGTGPSSHTTSASSTISDFLADVNDLVPLESADGEWGLEDYVVEVAATADQELSYECLHFQIIDSVLREDDEVVVRALGTEELRIRRLGGRHQISGDGRHLIDGVSFGRRWVRKGGRPGLVIPPRKRRRVEIEGEAGSEQQETQLLALMNDTESSVKGAIAEDDDDLLEDEEDDEDSSFDGDDDEPLLILARAEFDDADEEDGDELGEDEDEESVYMPEEEFELSAELKALLEDAEEEQLDGEADIEGLQQVAKAEMITTPRSGKRKRDLQDDGQAQEEESDFEGFSTPRHNGGVTLNQDNDSDFTSSSGSDSSDSDAEDTVLKTESFVSEEARRREPNALLNGFTDPIQPGFHEESSSGSEEDIGWVSDSSGSDAESSSVDSDSASGTSSSSESSSEEESDYESAATPTVLGKRSGKPELTAKSKMTNKVESSDNTDLHPTAPSKNPSTNGKTAPGSGSSRTRQNNLRLKRKKRLVRLKQQGLLPDSANYEDLRAFDERQAKSENNFAADSMENVDQIFEGKRKELLDRLQSEGQLEGQMDINRGFEDEEEELPDQPGSEVQLEEEIIGSQSTTEAVPDPFIGPVRPDHQINEESLESYVPQTASTPTSNMGDLLTETMSEPPKRRARLDITSSRRMLFSSLGLRNPKTLADEQALREKLDKDVRKVPLKDDRVGESPELCTSNAQGETQDDDAWKNKIVLSAVECDLPGVLLEPPPFPFEQGWDKNANRRLSKKKGRNHQRFYQNDSIILGEHTEDGHEFAPDMSTIGHTHAADSNKASSTFESRTLLVENADAEDLPLPGDFGALAALEKQSIAPGAVIAFKELHMNDSWEPQVSDYRVARVIGFNNDGEIRLRLSKRDRILAVPVKYDEQTGERMYSRFEVPMEEVEEEDNGVREMTTPDFIEPKLVESSHIQVPASFEGGEGAEDGSTFSNPKDESLVVPDSGEKQAATSHEETTPKAKALSITEIEVSSSRRQEITTIIQEAGFDSALDEELLQPMTTISSDSFKEDSSKLALQSQSNHPRGPDHSLEPVDDNANATVATSGLESPQFNGWSSSPPREGDYGFAGNDAFDEEWQSSPTADQSTPKASNSGKPVAYPRLSQLEINGSSVVSTTNGSSLQDAQRISHTDEADVSLIPSVSNADIGDFSEANQSSDDDEAPIDSGMSEIPQSDDNAAEPNLPPSETSPMMDSFLGGHDGHVSLADNDDDDYKDNEHEGEDDDDDSLPSLQQITSSQVQRRTTVTRLSKVSPPPIKKSLRNGKQRQSLSPTSSQDSPANQFNLKQSQRSYQPRLSQIPAGTPVVDLTFSSDPISPVHSDGTYGRDTRGARNRRLNGSGNVHAKARVDSEGLGKKRLLTKKKSGSQI